MRKESVVARKHSNIAKNQPICGLTLNEKNIARQDAGEHAAASHSNLRGARQPQDVRE
jgi:hypothetical protein